MEKKVRITSGIFWTLMGKNPIMEKSDAGAACLSWTFFFSIILSVTIRIGMCYLCTIHIIDAYSSTTRKNASPSMYIGGLYIGGLGEGKGSKKKTKQNKTFFPLPPLPLREAIYIYIYTHTMFVFPPSFSLETFMTLWTLFGNLWGSLTICLDL